LGILPISSKIGGDFKEWSILGVVNVIQEGPSQTLMNATYPMDDKGPFYVCKIKVQMFISGILGEKKEILYSSLTSSGCSWF